MKLGRTKTSEDMDADVSRGTRHGIDTGQRQRCRSYSENGNGAKPAGRSSSDGGATTSGVKADGETADIGAMADRG